MPNREIAQGRLLEYHQELMSYQGSVIGVLLGSRINEFYRHNKGRIQTIIDNQKAITKKYYQVGEDGKLIMEGEGETAKPVLVEGMDEKDFQNEMKFLMEAKVPFRI